MELRQDELLDLVDKVYGFIDEMLGYCSLNHFTTFIGSYTTNKDI